MTFTSAVNVRWDDLDAFGHVNNAAYLTYVQEARSDFTWYSRKRVGLKPLLSEMVVASANIDFLLPINDGGCTVDVSICVSRIGASSFDLYYEISKDGVIYAVVKTVQVAVSKENTKSRPLTDEERTFLNSQLVALPEGK